MSELSVIGLGSMGSALAGRIVVQMSSGTPLEAIADEI
jgi:3-hydroxyisobutyrate dehydrogenase-like beta-hydroxyacid dehydrogenase